MADSADNPDPTIVGPRTNDAAIAAQARAIAPGEFAGADVDGDVIYVGFTTDSERRLAELKSAFPGLDLRGYSARRTEDELTAIQEQLSAAMEAEANESILSVGVEVARNVVEVGVADLNAPEVRALRVQYGNAVHIFEDEPLELLSGVAMADPSQLAARPRPPAAGRDIFRDPMLAGMHIFSHVGPRPPRSCTAGFMYRGSLNPVESEEGGVITAGHCFDGQPATADWSQGEEVLGTFSRRRNVNRSRADAGTITTEFVKDGGDRRISNEVYISPGAGTIKITARRGLNAGRRDDLVCISGAFSGFHCGAVSKVGAGGRGFDYRLQRGVIIRGVYRATFVKACLPGDSGAPMFTGDGVALGIAFARNPRNPRNCFYSQIRNVENELRVPVFTGGGGGTGG